MSRYHVNVYRPDHDCSNGGVTEQCNRLLLVDEPDPPETINGLPVLVLERRGVPSMLCARPATPPRGIDSVDAGMFGGNFVWSSDSRFRQEMSQWPIPVHDRFEGRLWRAVGRRIADLDAGESRVQLLGERYGGRVLSLVGDSFPVVGDTAMLEFRDGGLHAWVVEGGEA